MNQKQALERARQILGRWAIVKFDRLAPVGARRQKIRADWRAMHNGGVPTDLTEFKRLGDLLLRNRCEVGEVGALFTRIVGVGETWEEAIAKAEKSKAYPH